MLPCFSLAARLLWFRLVADALASCRLVPRLTEGGAVSVCLFFFECLSSVRVPDLLFLLARSCRIVDAIFCFDRRMKVLIINS